MLGLLLGVIGFLVTAKTPGAQPALELQQVAPNVYAHFGRIELQTLENAADMSNIGVIVGRDAVAIVDTRGSAVVGRRRLQAIRTISDKPARYVINTHEHPDHVFGNAALDIPGVTFVGHHRLPREFAVRSEHYLNRSAFSTWSGCDRGGTDHSAHVVGGHDDDTGPG
jgi:glyoxylase-like metal-dependent hydrolase (beta-lactamase superfamily II)